MKHIVIIMFLSLFASCGPQSKPVEVKVSPEDQRKEQITKLFSPWDGSMPKLEKVIKKSMNDPDSYEHIETRYSDMKDYLLVGCEFRGNNAFGAKVKNIVTAKVDLNGNVIEIVE
jgi:hypothetical protein